MTRNRFKVFTLLLFVVFSAGAITVSRSAPEGANGTVKMLSPDTSSSADQDKQPTPQGKPAEQVYKNIQVFQGLPASQLQTVMTFMAGSLGVRCNYCHTTSAFEKDDKPEKQTARRMIRMVFDINKGNFGGENAVTCYTCHRGQQLPLTVPSVGPRIERSAPASDPASSVKLPTVEQVFDKYVDALGGKHALMKLTSVIMKGSRVGADGALVPEEVYQKAPNKLLVVTSYPDFALLRGFDGTKAWGRDNNEESLISEQDLAEIERDADFYKEVDLKQLYPQAKVSGKETVGDRENYVIEARSRAGTAERLYFDAQTGLLTRRHREHKILLGLFPTQTDYQDYKDIDGIKLPLTIRWSMPGRSWGRKITEVKYNTPIDDKKFSPPGVKN